MRRQTRRPARRERDAKRDGDDKTNETHDETTTTRKKASSRGRSEDKRTGKNKTPHFLTFRPTPSRLFSLIRRPQLFPRPRAWDERAAKQAHPARRLIHCLGGSHHSRHRIIRSRSPHLLIPGVIFPHAPFSVAHPFMPPSSPPTQDDRAKRPPPPLIMASIKRPAHSTSRTRRRTERGEWRAVHDRCLDRRCSRCPPPSRRISPRKVLSRGRR